MDALRYGKIRIEEGIIHFSSRMITNSVPCSDLVWAYHRRGPATEESSIRTLVSHFLVLVTNRGKRMECSMSEREIQECLQTIQALNPRIATGFPAGSRLLLQTLPNTRDLGAIET
ncbi:MAG: protein-tyrosine-phosphatase, partial [Blautia sp.]|nr:protein-tyrosine-phosphatase [Blautia sp.]